MPLALTRREGNKIYIGDDITITVAKFKGKSVVLNVDAPKNIKVIRDEILKRDLQNATVKR